MSIQSISLNTSLSSFQIVDSRSGNVTGRPFKKEGNEIKFNFRLLENDLLEVKTTSITFCKSLFYELVSRANYVVESTDELRTLNQDELLDTATLLAQHSLKRHAQIFRQFNSAGTFKSCSIDEKTFEELRPAVSETITYMKAGSGISLS